LHQWYWSYEYPDFLNSDGDFVEFDSYLVPESDLEDGALRMLEVDNRVILPEITHTRFILTAADVIHSFAIPALGVKCDAYPGRLNQFSVLINRLGTFYGQCSEICGILHSSMPIVLESVSIEKFLSWLQEQGLSSYPLPFIFTVGSNNLQVKLKGYLEFIALRIIIFVLFSLPSLLNKTVLYITKNSTTASQYFVTFIMFSVITYFIGTQLSIFDTFYCDSSNAWDAYFNESSTFEPVQNPVPGRRCPECLLERGDTVWVIPGTCCSVCGTLVT